MAKASSNRTSLFFVEESTLGVTPATPVFNEIRYSGEGVNFSIENIVSDEIRSDRQTTDTVTVSQSSGGNNDFELSFGAYDEFLEYGMFSAFGNPVGVEDEVTISFDNGAGTIDDSGSGFGDVVVGQWVAVTGASNADNNLVYRVTAASAASLTVSPVPGTTELAGASVRVMGQRMVNGTTRKSFTFQKRFEDATTIEYNNFTGCHINGMSMNFENGAILGGSFDILGLDGALTSTQFAGSSDVAAAANEVMNAVSNLKNIEFDDTATNANILSMTVELANNLRAQNAIGSLAACGIGVGRFEVSGAISIYFEDNSEYAKYTGSNAFKLSMRAEDTSGQAYVFTFPRIKYEDMTLVSGGTDTDIVLEGSWRALRDATLDAMMVIDRLPISNTDAA